MTRFDSLQAWLDWQEKLHPRPIDLGLGRVAGVYRQLNPEQKKLPTITVAGTNGKGSCVAFLEAIYRAAGYRVGAYTSPHILRYNERIRIDGEPVDDTLICEAFTRIDAARGETSLSYFEFGTLAALSIFADADLDIQLLEVGLGGRLDAVNIVDPDAAIVTTIALDHVDWLGHTEEAIGREKAGIFRPGVAAIIGDQQAPRSVVEVAEQVGAIALKMGGEFTYQKRLDDWEWRFADIQIGQLPPPAFKGEHQYRNASAAIMAVKTLQPVLAVSDDAIRQGLQSAQLPGRFQLIAGAPRILLDVGHNPQAVQTLIDYLREYFPEIRIHAVFAMMRDKDIAGVLNMMRDKVTTWYLAPLVNPRAASADMLETIFQQQGLDNVRSGFADFTEAFQAARQNTGQDELLLIFGSFFLVSEYLSKFS
ncbi:MULTISPECIES: bifunctional tetrahydrofolate synthase/dihydrofolate synthase [Methylomonas]|uniref:Dihydrofolate synthase/folylpolyglutamate synthase n=2 Tax=Methylomonas TaxID=416 RepID=A0A140E655_9GAMM|nr:MULTISPECIES: bifunctional tetrahydrofolate synthase/dihydrofolate synthase [Methylomonas]AMK78879.1 bifunctional folylpolyglutamate synthase/dihydrofolate synthase [Methylomonas denitrificans]OAI02151.1 bifunctional folylpolyglutamate synthase/dihydrofolate synthase [Methylomonas methanica]TCV78257.1 dihydrofolate synthase/folylpolyglutamate synthase [Methylomonas methanica]